MWQGSFITLLRKFLLYTYSLLLLGGLTNKRRGLFVYKKASLISLYMFVLLHKSHICLCCNLIICCASMCIISIKGVVYHKDKIVYPLLYLYNFCNTYDSITFLINLTVENILELQSGKMTFLLVYQDPPSIIPFVDEKN